MTRWAWLALIVGLTLGLSSQPAQAQASGWNCIFGPSDMAALAADGNLVTPFYGALGANGVVATGSPGYWAALLSINVATDTGMSTVTSAMLRMDGLDTVYDLRVSASDVYSSWVVPSVVGNEVRWATDTPAFYITWLMDSYWGSATSPFLIWEIEIAGTGTAPTICGDPPDEPDLVRPIAAANGHPWGIYGQRAFAASPGRPVHSPADGHISTLRRATTADCSGFGNHGGGFLSAYCTLNLPSPVSVRGFDMTTGEIGIQHSNERIWIVSVTTPSSGTYTYMVANADLYVSIGQLVSAGCVIGQTMRVSTGVMVLDGYNENEFYEFGVAGVPDAEYTDEPNTFAPCNDSPENRGCLGDSTLTDRSQWESGNGAIFEAPGYRLPPGGYLQANYILDSSRDPRMSAIVRPIRFTGHSALAGPSDMRLQLGLTVRTLELSVNDDSDYDNWQTLTIPAGPHPPDIAGFWTVRLENVSPGWVQVNKICVALGADVDPPEPPGPGGGNPPPPGPPPSQPGQPTPEGACGASVPFPAAGNDSITSWISWLWARQAQFFRCDLIRVLRSIQETIGNFAHMMGFSVRWNMAAMQASLTWMGRQLLPWLAGYMANMQPSTVNVEEGCNSFWCALASILGNIINGIIAPIVELIVDLVGLAAQLLGQILSGIIDLIFSFINAALALVDIARVAFAVLLDAWINTEPAEIPGWATCPPSPDASSPLCILFWVLENTVFTHAGALIIPLLTGWFSLHLVLWFVGDIKQTFIKLGQAT